MIKKELNDILRKLVNIHSDCINRGNPEGATKVIYQIFGALRAYEKETR